MAAQMPPQYTPSAEKPLMKGMRAKLVQALDENKSLFEIMLMMDDIVEDVKQVGGSIPLHKTVDSFREGIPMMQMANLLHYVNVKLLRSIVAGTLAFDLYQDPDLGANCQYNDEATAGTYVVSLSIEGRQGRFLNYHELKELVHLVELYAEKADMWAKNKEAWDDLDPDHQTARDFIQEVDSMASRAIPDGTPMFAQSRSGVEKIRELARMLKRRADPSLDVQNKGQTHQVQAPAMVGCTTEKIAKRTKAHYPQWTAANANIAVAVSLQSTTKTWGLTLCLLYRMKLTPVIVHVAALPFMYKADLPRTEILLTTLARSLVWQDGFNVTQGGEKLDDPSVISGTAEKKSVCYARDFLKTNLSATLQRMEEVRNKIAIVENLGKIDLDALETEVNKLKASQNELQLKVVELENSLASKEFMDKYNELKDRKEELDEALTQWKGWEAFLGSLKEE